jgi:hypothetical protein
VNIVKIEVVNAEVCELLASNWLNAVVLGEGAPELGDNEEILTLYETVLDGSCETLSRLLLVTIIWLKALVHITSAGELFASLLAISAPERAYRESGM